MNNAANEALERFVAHRLRVSRQSVRVVSGGGSRRKVLELDGVTPARLAELFPSVEGAPG